MDDQQWENAVKENLLAPRTVTVSKAYAVEAYLVQGETVNGNLYYAYSIPTDGGGGSPHGGEVFISKTPEEASRKMCRAIKNKVIF